METSTVATSLGPVVVRHTPRESHTATILLHGAAGSWKTWRPAIAAAESGGSVADLVVPDLPGWGDSPVADLSTLDTGGIADAVCDVARALGYHRWRVVGHSLGGFVALELAVREPVATESVVLVSATTFGARGDRLGALGRLVHYAPLELLAAGIRMLAALGPFAARFVRALDRTGLLSVLAAPLFAIVDRQAVHELARDLRPGAFLRAMQCAATYPAAWRWARIRCPVVALHGDRDVFVGRDDDARLAAVIPDFHAVVVPATGHFGHVEHPTILAGALHAR